MKQGQGMFITVEGGDGAGKSTQISYIRDYLDMRGFDVLMTREPGGTEIGEKLRAILLSPASKSMDPITEAYIYASSRAQLVREIIKPALEAGMVVLCDRFLDSSIAYQGFGRGLGPVVSDINANALEDIEPDYTFWLRITPEDADRRLAQRSTIPRDRIESLGLEFQNKVFSGYETLAKENPDRIITIDANRSINNIEQDIRRELDRICDEYGKRK